MSEQTTNPLPEEVVYPVLVKRIQSVFIDTVFIVGMMFLFSAILSSFEQVPDWVRMSVFIFIWVVYEPLFVTIGCTLGNYVIGVRVRKHNDFNARINLFSALIRYAVKMALGWLSFVTIHTSNQRRAIHDLAAGSVMIYAPQK